VALSAERLAEWMASDLSNPDLLVIQIDGLQQPRTPPTAKGFRRLKAYKRLPVLRAALAAHQSKYGTQRVEHNADAA
jgi:hypothetical protein